MATTCLPADGSTFSTREEADQAATNFMKEWAFVYFPHADVRPKDDGFVVVTSRADSTGD
jgi:hypothetical protein